ncbi:hypothetical protein [Lacihabitans sp. LS3-19]|uniref:hypothetical protein n=1 Tax=Lacihabitans sp. LS3-19 TaxID=2487335 RepID=UPI0020CD9083|nr:hypothetical protein [Lacihabitans sp. LS3-19]
MKPGFACELVNSKGKNFKFDDISCLIKYMKIEGTSQSDYEFIVVNQFQKEEFIDAKEGLYLQSENFKSPMRGDIAAFKNSPIQIDISDYEVDLKKVLTWEEIFDLF